MCGICGELRLRQQEQASLAAIEKMVATMRHRGPDAQLTHVDGPLAFGHARLSIIDLSGGYQPLFNEDRSIVLIGNGEIYNYRELRAQLETRGHVFRTGSDNEVILHLWEDQGARLVEQLRGMFAFALYDTCSRTLFAARDFFGQKPFFYHVDQDRVVFASEIKALLSRADLPREIDLEALDGFLFRQYVSSPRTIFQGISQLPAGSTLTVRDGKAHVEKFWQPVFEPVDSQDDQALLEQVEQAVLDAVESHLISDVPVGVFLSGGIDSSLMLAIATRLSGQRLKTFSIAFKGTSYDESSFAKRASELYDSHHHEIDFRPDRLIETIERVGQQFDQPLGDSASLPMMILSQEASKDIRVVLTGDGGDEVFGGYRKYKSAAKRWTKLLSETGLTDRMFSANHLAVSAPDHFGLRKLQSRIGMVVAPTLRSTYTRQYWEGWQRHALYQSDVSSQLARRRYLMDQAHGQPKSKVDPINEMLRQDQTHYLPDDLLLKTDYTTMAYGLESRAPLLDHRLAEVAGRLPTRLKVTPKQTKVALRKIAERLLPEELAKRKKKGFSFGVGDWFRAELSSWVKTMLLHESVSVPALFNRSHVARILEEHQSGNANHGGRIYTLLTLELWYRNHFLK